MTSYELILKIAGFIHFEMENEPINTDLVEEKAMDVEQATEQSSIVKKPISIVDTRLAIKPFKMCPEGLPAFVQTCNHKRTGGSTPEMFGVFLSAL